VTYVRLSTLFQRSGVLPCWHGLCSGLACHGCVHRKGIAVRVLSELTTSWRLPVPQRRKISPIWTLFLIVVAPGCMAIYVPSVSNVSSPIRAVRVLDADTCQDIPDAFVSYDTDLTNKIREIENCEFRSRSPGANKADYVSADPFRKEFLLRGSDQSFPVPMKLRTGYLAIPLVPVDFVGGSTPLYCPRATIEARSSDHYWAAISYTTACRPVAGWASAATTAEPGGMAAQTARCELDHEGTLRFYVHRMTRFP
jgi:hypothetical protein